MNGAEVSFTYFAVLNDLASVIMVGWAAVAKQFQLVVFQWVISGLVRVACSSDVSWSYSGLQGFARRAFGFGLSFAPGIFGLL